MQLFHFSKQFLKALPYVLESFMENEYMEVQKTSCFQFVFVV
jgi:hypothetical protein